MESCEFRLKLSEDFGIWWFGIEWCVWEPGERKKEKTRQEERELNWKYEILIDEIAWFDGWWIDVMIENQEREGKGRKKKGRRREKDCDFVCFDCVDVVWNDCDEFDEWCDWWMCDEMMFIEDFVVLVMVENWWKHLKFMIVNWRICCDVMKWCSWCVTMVVEFDDVDGTCAYWKPGI